MELDEEKQTTWRTTSPQYFVVHVVYAVAFVAASIWFQCQLADLRRDNGLLKAKVELLALQMSATNGKVRQNAADEIADTRERQPVNSSSRLISLSTDRSRQKRSASRTRSTRRRIVAAQFVLDSDRLKAAKENERSGGQPMNYTGPNLKWNVTDLSSPPRSHIEADGTTVTIAEDGLYFVYAQLTYFNSAAKSTFKVETESKTLLKCFQSVDTVSDAVTGSHSHRIKTCYTAGLFALKHGDKLQLVNGSSRAIQLDEHANFWGLIKLHDFNDSS